MSRKVKRVAGLAGAIAPWLFMMAGVAAAADERYMPTQVIPVPGGLTSFDISVVDPAIDTFALADRTNKAIDLIDTRSKTLVQRPASPPFAGVIASPANASGPNGVIIVDHREIWAADGPLLGGCVSSPTGLKCSGPLLAQSSVKVIDVSTGITTHIIQNGGQRRADELCVDPRRGVVLVANDDPVDNFLTFISTSTYSVVGTIRLNGTDPNGNSITADGIEQCQWNPRNGKFYLSVPATKDPQGNAGPGKVLVISSHNDFKVEQAFTIPTGSGCTGPQGLAIGPNHEIQLGCGGANSIIIDDANGNIIATQTGEGGADEVWYNPGSNHFVIAGTSAGKLGVEDAGPHPNADPDAATAIGSHSVAADPIRNEVYIPIRSTAFPANPPTVSTICGSHGGVDANGCIAIYSKPSGSDDQCLVKATPVIAVKDGEPVFQRARCRNRDRVVNQAR